jgi:general secretion pathway protein N
MLRLARPSHAFNLESLGNAVISLIRLLGTFLVISSVLAARAAADAIDDHAGDRPQVEALSPAVQGNGVVDTAPSGANPAPSPKATPRTGNVLSAIPLSALSATRDRPLFYASRRPPAEVLPVAPPPPKQEALPPPPSERPLLALVGTIVSRKASVAVLQGANVDAISRLRLGQENDGWRVRGIGLRSIVVEKGEQSVELGLPRADGAPTASGAAASPHE